MTGTFKVKSILKERSKCLEKEDKVIFGEGFQEKANETFQSKKKKELFRFIRNQQSDLTLALRIPIVLGPFTEVSNRKTWHGDSYQLVTEVPKLYQNATFPVMVKRPLMDKCRGAKVRNQPQMTPSSGNSKRKVPEMLPLRDFENVYPLVKTLFKEPRKTVSLADKLKFFQNNWQKITGDPIS